jgi:arsenate reductase
VLFVCLGNVCRSQMAETFGHALGKGVFESSSAGLTPGMMIDPVTKQVMAEKGLDMGDQFPKSIALAATKGAELVVNMSGYPLPPGVKWPRVEWQVPDPHTHPLKVHREVRDLVERLVMQLVLEYRTKRR